MQLALDWNIMGFIASGLCHCPNFRNGREEPSLNGSNFSFDRAEPLQFHDYSRRGVPARPVTSLRQFQQTLFKKTLHAEPMGRTGATLHPSEMIKKTPWRWNSANKLVVESATRSIGKLDTTAVVFEFVRSDHLNSRKFR